MWSAQQDEVNVSSFSPKSLFLPPPYSHESFASWWQMRSSSRNDIFFHWISLSAYLYWESHSLPVFMLLLGDNISTTWISSEGKAKSYESCLALLCCSPKSGVLGKSPTPSPWSSYSITSESTWFSVKTWYSWPLVEASACNSYSTLWEWTFLVVSVNVIFESAERARVPEKCAVAFPLVAIWKWF